MKNEIVLELFNSYGTLNLKYATKIYLNQYKQNKNHSVNDNNNGDNSKNNQSDDFFFL